MRAEHIYVMDMMNIILRIFSIQWNRIIYHNIQFVFPTNWKKSAFGSRHIPLTSIQLSYGLNLHSKHTHTHADCININQIDAPHK